MAVLHYSDKASRDLAQIWQHYRETADIDVANDNIRKIRTKLERTLGRLPRSGRLRPEFGPGVRSYPVLLYIVFYVADERGLYILGVLHGHRDIRAPLMSLLTAV
jgi:toxin ParE1/3/4